MIIQKMNRMGMVYQISALNEHETIIKLGKESITVRASLEAINQAWYNWQMKGEYIQLAFYFLNADEREFILSGITPKQWNEIFPEDEDEE